MNDTVIQNSFNLDITHDVTDANPYLIILTHQ